MPPMRPNTPNDSVNIKLLVLGIASVGKSSLLLRFTDQQWLPEGETNPTIGVDTWVMSTNRGRVDDTSLHHEVYDVTSRETFDAISWWFAEHSNYAPEPVVKMIVGNKSDKSHMRQVSAAEGVALAAQNKCLFIESSAKTAVGVRETFREVLERIIDVPELCSTPEPTSKAPNDLENILK